MQFSDGPGTQPKSNELGSVPCEGVLEDLAAGGEDELVGGDDAAVALDAHVAEHALLARHEALQLPVERRQVQVERRRRRQRHRVHTSRPKSVAKTGIEEGNVSRTHARRKSTDGLTASAGPPGGERRELSCWLAGRLVEVSSYQVCPSCSMIQRLDPLQEQSSIMSHQL